MHVVIIPSEEFVPGHNHELGIFQYHQASILQAAGYKVGALSVTQSFSIPMLLKSFLLKGLFKKAGNITDSMSARQVLNLGYKKMVRQRSFLKVEEVGNIPVYRIDGFYFLSPSDTNNKYGWIKAGVIAFQAYIDQHGIPDVIHAHNAVYAGMLAKRIKELYNVPYIITEHSTAFSRNLIISKKVDSWITDSYKSSKGAFAVSRPFCELLEQRYKGISFSYLPNVLDPYLETRPFKKNEERKKEFVFLNLAQLHSKKNHKLLIEAFAMVKQVNANVKLWIAGGGELYDELKKSITEKGLDKDVLLLGPLDREKVMDIIQQTDCMVLSSNYETFGVVLIEAMLFGKPVVATKCGGPESFVTDTVGLTVDKENKTQLVDAMNIMIEQYTQYDAGLIRQYAINEFGKGAFLSRIGAVYNQSISQ
ncbi:MAG TPA: glycosyltransferase [Ferruginibacter sp.]|jgi:glycosyltransferase involved in cell wall biosynthesis|nr:glycosyltransferase [Ferruginibacter sp.]